jgi:fructose-1,6-bisphosphatase/inositol monophosphatase family enzyme
MADSYAEYLQAAEAAARTAGAVIREAFHKPKTLTVKGEDTDLVTETDKAAENIVMTYLKEKFPSHRFIGEEVRSCSTPRL